MTFYVFRRKAPPADSWYIVHRGSDELRAWAAFDAAVSTLRRGSVKILRDGVTVESVSRPRRKMRRGRNSAAPLRTIVKWVGPAATSVLLECGHLASTHAAHRTRCLQCGGEATRARRKTIDT